MIRENAIRDRIKNLRWWYRTTFKQWFKGPEYADCHECDGDVYHYQGGCQLSIIKYECRDCAWSRLGTPEFEFYRDQEPDDSIFDVYREIVQGVDSEKVVELAEAGDGDAIRELYARRVEEVLSKAEI